MKSPQPAPLASRPGRAPLRRLLSKWPVLVWIAVCALALLVHRQGVQFSRMNGVVDALEQDVTATGDLVVRSIAVRAGQPVRRGEQLVALDDSLLRERRDSLLTRIAQRKAALLLSASIESARTESDLRDLERDQAGDGAELAKINESLQKIEESLADQRLSAFWPFLLQSRNDLELNASRLAVVHPLYAPQIERARNTLQTLEENTKKLRAQTEPLTDAIDERDAIELQTLDDRLRAAILLANHDGTVDRILVEPGQLARAGQTLLRVVAPPRTISGFLPQDQAYQVRPGMPVWISSSFERYRYWESRVASVAPRVGTVADTTSPLPNRRLHGIEVAIVFPTDCPLLPGQTVVIHMERPGSIPLALPFLRPATPATAP